MIPVESAVFQETPWPHYTVMMLFDSSFGGLSALEHTNSHLGIYNPQAIGSPILTSVTAHEIFHAWNVKRLRPADMVPYRYDRTEPTVWLWVSEGITDYYADLALLRGGVVTADQFLGTDGGQDRQGGGGAAHGARGCVALHLDPPDRREPVSLLSEGVAGRASCSTS